jgi:hypothetical protein
MPHILALNKNQVSTGKTGKTGKKRVKPVNSAGTFKIDAFKREQPPRNQLRKCRA